MNKSTFAKVFGWLQFGAQLGSQVISTGGLPHGALGWVGFVTSLATAVGIHAASGTDGSK